MPSGPNCFFVSPDGEMIVSGSTEGSHVADDLFGGNTVANSDNRGALSSFVIGNPTAATSLNIRINQSGGMGSATYIWKDGSSADSFANYYGEPDRRWEWDRHSPWLTDPTKAHNPSFLYWDSAQTTDPPDIGFAVGCALEDIQKEFIYVKGTGVWNNTKIGVYHRTLTNTESAWSATEITGLKDGTKFRGNKYFSVCSHTDGKIKLAVINDGDIDIYESSDGIDFSLVCELACSRFAGFRLFGSGKMRIKIASSGAYLKLVFMSVDIVDYLGRRQVFILDKINEALLNNESWINARIVELFYITGMQGSGTAQPGSQEYQDAVLELWVILMQMEGYQIPQALMETINALPLQNLLATEVSGALAVNQGEEFSAWSGMLNHWMGSLTSADGGATWQLSDLPSPLGSNIPLMGASDFDLTGLSDGSGQFVLMFKARSRTVEVLERGQYGNLNPVSKFIPDVYYGAISVGVSPFIIHTNLTLKNLYSSGVPYLCCNNDWIWFISAAEMSSALEDYISLQNENNQGLDIKLESSSDAQSLLEDLESGVYGDLIKTYDILFKENQMYFISLRNDPSKTKWTNLGSNDVYLNSRSFGTSSTNNNDVYGGYELLEESVVTGGAGSYHISPVLGNLYNCGPSLAWVRGLDIGERNDAPLGTVAATYSKFSGWQTMPAHATNTDMMSGTLDVEPFRHQPRKVLSKPEFNFQWGIPACTRSDGGEGPASWQAPSTQGSCWRTQRDSSTSLALNASGGHITIYSPTTTSKTRGYFTFVDPTVVDVAYWTTGVGSAENFAPPKYQLMAEGDYPEVVYGIRPYGKFVSKRFHGFNCSFTIGWVCDSAAFANHSGNWSSGNNDLGDFIGAKIRTYIHDGQNLGPSSYNDLAMEVQIQFTTTEVRVYLPYATALPSAAQREVIKLTPDPSTYGLVPFKDYFWEVRFSMSTQRFSPPTNWAINPSSFSHPRFQLSIRRWGSNEWITSSVFKNINFATLDGYWPHRSIQFASVGIFQYTSTSADTKHVKIKDFKIVRDNDLGQYNLFADVTDESKIDAVRGRAAASLPCFVKNQQSIVWGGASGYDGDKYTYETESNYDSSNAIKYASPQIQYRTKGSTSDVKTGSAELIVSLPDPSRSVGNKAFLHGGVALFGINAENVKVEYSEDSTFSASASIFQSNTKVATGRIVSAGFNNYIKMKIDGETLNDNDSKYSETQNHTYYAKFSTSTATCTAISGLSFPIKIRRGQYFTLDIPSFNLDGSGFGASLIGTSIQIYSDTMVSMFDQPSSLAIPAAFNPRYMKITLSEHLGIKSYYRFGSVIAGMTYGFQNVPINWEHETTVVGNVQSFTSRSGIRWGYENGPSTTTFSGVIAGDVFKQERQNIRRIMASTTQFSNRPIAMVFDGSAYTAPTGSSHGSFDIRMYVDPENILYGTMSNELSLSNAGWGYDESLQKWVPIGDMEITITETV